MDPLFIFSTPGASASAAPTLHTSVRPATAPFSSTGAAMRGVHVIVQAEPRAKLQIASRRFFAGASRRVLTANHVSIASPQAQPFPIRCVIAPPPAEGLPEASSRPAAAAEGSPEASSLPAAAAEGSPEPSTAETGSGRKRMGNYSTVKELSKEEVDALLVSHPELERYSRDAVLLPLWNFLRKAEVERLVACSVHMARPLSKESLTKNVEENYDDLIKVLDKVQTLHEAGLHGIDTFYLLNEYPEVVIKGAELETDIKTVLKLLAGVNITGRDVNVVLRQYPFLLEKRKKIVAAINYLRLKKISNATIGIMFKVNAWAVTRGLDHIEELFSLFKKFGVTEMEPVLAAFPRLLGYTTIAIRRKLEFLLGEMKRTPEDILSCPALFDLKLGSRVGPRVLFLEHKGISGVPLVDAVMSSDVLFAEEVAKVPVEEFLEYKTALWDSNRFVNHRRPQRKQWKAHKADETKEAEPSATAAPAAEASAEASA